MCIVGNWALNSEGVQITSFDVCSVLLLVDFFCCYRYYRYLKC